jgi:hypothetical protein
MKKLLTALLLSTLVTGSTIPVVAQTETVPPPEDLLPRENVEEEEDAVDDESRKTADDALSNFKQRAGEEGVDVEGLEEQARGVMEQTGVTEEDLEQVGREIRDAAREADLTEEDAVEAAGAIAESLRTPGESAETGATEDPETDAEAAAEVDADAAATVAEEQGETQSEVEAALRALEELGAQAERALEEDEALVIDDMTDETDAEPSLPAEEEAYLTDEGTEPLIEEETTQEYPAVSDSTSPTERARQLAESIIDEETLQEIEARRQELFEEANAQRDEKRARIEFRRAMTRALNNPDITVLREYAAEAKTEREKRSYLRQYYTELFSEIRSNASNISEYVDQREKEYMDRLNNAETEAATPPVAEPAQLPEA